MKNDCKYSAVRDIVDDCEICVVNSDYLYVLGRKCCNGKCPCDYFSPDNEVTSYIKKRSPFITVKQYKAIIALFGSFLKDSLSKEEIKIFKAFFELWFGEDMA